MVPHLRNFQMTNIESTRVFWHRILKNTTGFEVQPSDAVHSGAPSFFFLGRVQLSPIERKVQGAPKYGRNWSNGKSLNQLSFGIGLGMNFEDKFHNQIPTFLRNWMIHFKESV